MDWNAYLAALRARLDELVRREVAEHLQEARADLDAFLERSQADLRRWMVLRLENRLTDSELASLVRGQLALAELSALQQAGLARIRLDRLRTAILDTVLSSLFEVVA